MKTSEFDYHLPPELIAQHPMNQRDASRLLVLGKNSGDIRHQVFRDITDYLGEGDVLVRNDTRVFSARLYAQKASGARAEFLFIEQNEVGDWVCMVRPGRKVRPGEVFTAGPIRLEILDILPEGFRLVRVESQEDFYASLEEYGEIPLPKYITEPLARKQSYQTVFARETGSVAAPTAGLHFTQELLSKVQEKGCRIASLTLHVGPGTFRPVKAENIHEHVMHAERYHLSQENAQIIRSAKRVIALGTTSMRTLEAIAKEKGEITACSGRTDIFIYPGHTFRAVQALITNFHLPKSTLLMLVSAFSSTETILRAYEEAVQEQYRFFSFGDAMFITDQI